MKTRRDFIRESLVTGAALTLSGACRFGGNETAGIDSADIGRLRTGLAGQLILPGEQLYDRARRVFWRNPMTDMQPGVVAQCARADDVARCVAFAVEQGLPLAVRTGGHSFLGWGTCDDGIVIDTTLLDGIEINPVARTARVGGGVLTLPLVAAAGEHGLACVQAECPTVGVAGLTLGGGLGWLAGKHGAACDHLLSAELVTADGQVVTASAEENPELYWAIRGGGGNFGVTTALTLQLHPIGDVVAGRLSYRFGDARAVLRGFGEHMAGAPDEFQAVALLRREEGEPRIHITVVWSGDPSEGDARVRPLRSVASPVEDTVERRAFRDTFGMAPARPPASNAVKGSYLERLTTESIETILDRFAQAPGTGPAIGLDHYTHGAVCRVPPDATAFPLRAPSAVHVWIIAGWDDPSDEAASLGWMNDTWSALQAFSGGRTYANFPAAETQTPGAAYGENVSRLAAVKNQYDPGNLFRRNQNIQPAE